MLGDVVQAGAGVVKFAGNPRPRKKTKAREGLDRALRPRQRPEMWATRKRASPRRRGVELEQGQDCTGWSPRSSDGAAIGFRKRWRRRRTAPRSSVLGKKRSMGLSRSCVLGSWDARRGRRCGPWARLGSSGRAPGGRNLAARLRRRLVRAAARQRDIAGHERACCECLPTERGAPMTSAGKVCYLC